MNRAIECISKYKSIRQDSNDIRKLQSKGFLPQKVWNEFISAQQALDTESQLIQAENAQYKYHWGAKHRHNIFSKAAQVIKSSQQSTHRVKRGV